jgi:hypothetical protein
MKITKSQLREIIREEIKKLNESGIGRLGTDQADVLQAIVMRNKNKRPKDILKLALKDKFLSKYIKRQGIGKEELLSYIEDDLTMSKYM